MMRRERGAHHHVNVVILRAGRSSGNDGMPADKNIGGEFRESAKLFNSELMFIWFCFILSYDWKETSVLYNRIFIHFITFQ